MINLQNVQREYQGQNVVTPWDRLKRFMFDSYPVIKTPVKITDEDALLEAALPYKDKSDMVWVVFDDIEVNPNFPWTYRPNDILAKTVIHTFPRVVKRTNRPVSWGDIQLVPTNGVSHATVQNKIVSSYHVAEFDVFMISFHEAEADENFTKLRERFKDAQHVKNVEGIGNAHKKVGELAKTEMVYIVDADADITGHFSFDFIPPMSKRKNTTYVWSARNPINDLEYGYGGVKLFPREQLLSLGHELPDYTTGVSFYQPIADVSNITRFNKDPYRTWRSAFRECVKLASSVNPNQRQKETDARLETWCTVDNGGRFGRYCLKGANEGKAYGIEHKDDVEALSKINDFEWLREQFVASMKKR
jgi:Mor family transcriptional regulator